MNEQVLRQLDNVDRKGFFFKSMSEELYHALTTQKLSFYHHRHAIVPQTYMNNLKLRDFFKITALGKDHHGKEFVAASEAKHYPIYTTQYHPEKNAWEWNAKANHSLNGIMTTTIHSTAFVHEVPHLFN